MSKSSKNYIGVSEPATEMVNKIMSISDDLMARYYSLLLGEDCDTSQHPRDAKLELARRIAERYHDSSQADTAVQAWLNKSKDNSAGATELAISDLPDQLTVLTLASSAFEIGFGIKKSNGELKKQSIAPGAIQLNGEKLTDPFAEVALKSGDILRLSKKFTAKLI